MTSSGYGDLTIYRRMARQARSSWPEITALFLVGLLATPLALLAPLPLKIAVDSVLNARPLPAFLDAVLPARFTSSPTTLLIVVAALTVLIAFLAQLQAFAQRYLSAAAGENLVLQFRALIFGHMQRLSLTYHDAIGTADSVYRIQNDAPAIRYIVIDGFVPSVSSALTFVGMLYVAMRLDWQLALVGLTISPALLVASHVYRPRLRNQSRDVRKLESSAMAVVHEVLGALRVVKAFGQEEREGDRFVDRSTLGVHGRIDLAKTEGHFNVIVGLVTAAGTAAVLFIGVGHVRSGVLSLGDLLLVSGYIAKLYEPVKTISRKIATLQGHLASLERVFSVLDATPDVTEKPDAIPISRAKGAVALRHVSFSYAKDRPVLHDISFEIAPGTRLGIAGTTGAGKSTLISLLMRLYDAREGQILLDGVDLRDYKLSDLRRQFAIVLQDTVLFSGTVAENIAYAVPGASRNQVIAAAQAANAHEFIERLPQGYDTQVGERGVQVSGGQRQRIALARAFLKDSPVLILDEPTSAVDQQTEAAIVDALERLQQGRTVIIISHRPSAVAHCSSFLTIEHGRIVPDTGAIPAQPVRPISPGPIASAKRRDSLLAHPAVQAWRRLGADRAVPDRICSAKNKVNPNRTRPMTAYRLEGIGADGSNVIAKRCKRADGLVEGAVYEQILPLVPLPRPRYYGAVPEPNDDPERDGCWLFIGEVQGDNYDVLLPEHRVAAGRWLGILHTHARYAASQTELPDAGPTRYRTHMRAARDLIRNHLDNPSLTADDLEFFDLLLGRFDELDEHWDWLENVATGLPPTLVHGDFNAKNLRVLTSPTPQIVAFDWEDSGRGVPTADLAQGAAASCRISASPDLATYLSVVQERWPDCDRADVERLATCGAVFRALAMIEWDSKHLPHDWADLFVPNLRLYETELARALDRLGWAWRSVSGSRRPALEGRAG